MCHSDLPSRKNLPLSCKILASCKDPAADSPKLRCWGHALPRQPPVKSWAWLGPGPGHSTECRTPPADVFDPELPQGWLRLWDLLRSLTLLLPTWAFFPLSFHSCQICIMVRRLFLPSCFFPFIFLRCRLPYLSLPLNISHSQLRLSICFLEDPNVNNWYGQWFRKADDIMRCWAWIAHCPLAMRTLLWTVL